MDSIASYLALCLMTTIPVFYEVAIPLEPNWAMAYWDKMYAAILTRAAHWKTY